MPNHLVERGKQIAVIVVSICKAEIVLRYPSGEGSEQEQEKIKSRKVSLASPLLLHIFRPNVSGECKTRCKIPSLINERLAFKPVTCIKRKRPPFTKSQRVAFIVFTRIKQNIQIPQFLFTSHKEKFFLWIFDCNVTFRLHRFKVLTGSYGRRVHTRTDRLCCQYKLAKAKR